MTDESAVFYTVLEAGKTKGSGGAEIGAGSGTAGKTGLAETFRQSLK